MALYSRRKKDPASYRVSTNGYSSMRSINRLQGWFAYLNQARGDKELLRAYAELDKIRRAFQRMNVLAFEEPAQAIFKSLRRECRRLGTLDLRIASIVLTTHGILLSRNLRDFRQVAGLAVEDWTV
jgi:tRNA(fMet)-specific endonuclease VapC